MPQPGDPYADAFVSEVGQCWRMVHDRQGQAAHCLEPTTSTGRWYSSRDDGTYWRVWSCPDHLAGLTAVRETGWRAVNQRAQVIGDPYLTDAAG